MSWYKFSQIDISLEHMHMDSHSGQNDWNLVAYIKGTKTPIGMIEYTTYEGDVYINHILVKPEFRRNRVGERMMKDMKAKYPQANMDLGMMTDDGAALHQHLKRTGDY